MTPRPLILAALFLVLPTGLPAAMAAQSLVPTPYPSTSPAAVPLNPAPMRTGSGQGNLATPYPQATGAASQGNPSSTTIGSEQQQVPSTYRQKYGTDQK